MTKLSPERAPRKKLTCHQTFKFSLLVFLSSVLMACGTTPSQPAGTSVANSGTTLYLTPASVDFGSLKPSQSTTRAVRLSNIGSAAVNIDSVSISPAGPFNVDSPTGSFALAPAKTVQLQVTFTPKSNDYYLGTLTILTSENSSTYSSKSTAVSRTCHDREASCGTGGGILPMITHNINLPVSGAADDGGGYREGVAISVTPSSETLQSGQSVQFTASVTGTSNTAILWSAELGSVNSSGFYTAPNVASQTVDTISATSAVDPSKKAAASVLILTANIPETGVYSVTTPPPLDWYPFNVPNSIFNQKLPSSPRCLGASSDGLTSGNCAVGDTIAKANLTGRGTCYSSIVADMQCSLFDTGTESGNDASGYPGIYYSTASDPWYVCNNCAYESPGINVSFHAPVGAEFSGNTGGDQYIAIYDQAQGLFIVGYAYGEGTNFSIGNSTCAGSGSPSCALAIPGISALTAARVGIDVDWDQGKTENVTIGGNSYTIGSTVNSVQGVAGMPLLRLNEWAGGTINHALQIAVGCIQAGQTGNYPFPNSGSGSLSQCADSDPNNDEPLPGMLFFLDYTPTQIAAMGLPAWQAGILTALSVYGGYVSQTGGTTVTAMSVPGTGGNEGQQACYYYNSSECQTLIQQAINQGGFNGVCNTGSFTSPINNNCVANATSPSSARFEAYILQGIPLTIGTYGTDYSGRSCSTAPGPQATRGEVKNPVMPLRRRSGYGSRGRAFAAPATGSHQGKRDAVHAPAVGVVTGELGEEVTVELGQLHGLDPSAGAANDVGVGVLD